MQTWIARSTTKQTTLTFLFALPRSCCFHHFKLAPLLHSSVVLLHHIMATAFIAAASKGDHCTVHKWLKDTTKVIPEIQQSEALRMACENGHAKIVRLLLKTRREIPSWISTRPFLEHACSGGHHEVAAYLLELEGINVTANAVLAASLIDNTELVRLLLCHSGKDKGKFSYYAVKTHQTQRPWKDLHADVKKVLVARRPTSSSSPRQW